MTGITQSVMSEIRRNASEGLPPSPDVALALLDRIAALEAEAIRTKALLQRAGRAWRKVVTGRLTVAEAREEIDPLARIEAGP